ncbi:MAG: DUF624 domain-containing protein [Clostridia bacterium]|nr:DUF624 domain-containing protein [Clostridia bacterium]
MKKRLDEIDSDLDEEGNKKKKKRKRFDWFGLYRFEGKGVEKDEKPLIDSPTLINFFKFLRRNFSRLISVNLLFVFGNFPIFFYFVYRAGYFGIESTAPYYQMFAPLYGASLFDTNPVTASLYGIYGIQVSITSNTAVTYAFLFLTALLLLTFGPVNAGVTYILRNTLRGEPVFLWSDFWHTIRRNLRQSIIMGAIDVIMLLLLYNDVTFFLSETNSGSIMMLTMFFISLLMFVVYIMMRFYMYHIMITFDLSIFKIFKNSLIFSILGIKRNIMAVIGFIIVLAINYLLFAVFIPLGVILPFVIVPALLKAIETYAAFPVIKKYMIDPYYRDSDNFEEVYGEGDEEFDEEESAPPELS